MAAAKLGLGRVALLLFSLALAAGMLEAVLTLVHGGGGRGPYEMAEEWRSPFVFRESGGDDFGPAPLQPRGLRVLSYGDSIAAAWGLEASAGYGQELSRRATALRGAPVQVLDMRRGHSPTVYTFHLRSDLPRLRPDGVIVEIELLNDVSDEARVATRGADAFGLPVAIDRARYIVGWDGQLLAPIALRGAWYERTKLYAGVSRWFGRVMERRKPNPLFAEGSDRMFYSLRTDRFLLTEMALEEGFDRLFSSLAATHRFLRERGVEMLLMLVPSRYVFTEERASAFSRDLLARGAERARQSGIPLVLPETALRAAGGSELYQDFCHPTAKGHAVLAEVLAPRVSAW